MTAKLKSETKQILRRCIITGVFLIGILLFYWKAELQDSDRPIAHRAEVLTNEFELTVGEIRGINIKRRNELKNVILSVEIQNLSGNIVWQNQYKNIDITSEYKELEHFYPENLIDVPKGKYVVKCYINEKEDREIRTEFVEYRGNYKKYYGVFSILVITILLISLIITNLGNIELHKKYFVLAILMGVFYGLVFPSLSAPDESSHFLEAYKISSKIMGKQVFDSEGYVLLRADDYDSITYLQNMDTISEWYESSIHGSLQDYVPADYRSSVSIKEKYAYLFPALGITIARLFGLSGKMLISLGRFFNLLLTTSLIAFAIKLSPRYKLFFSILGLLPETLLLTNSYSYDALNIALSILTISYFLYLLERETIKTGEILSFIFLLGMFVSIKIVYFPFVGLLFLLPRSKISINKRAIAIVISIALIIGVGWGIVNIPNMIELAFNNGNMMSEGTQLINMKYMVSHFTDILGIIGRTFFEDTYSYIQSMTGTMYGISRFGELTGYSTPAWIMIMVYTLFAIALLGEKKIESGKSQYKWVYIILLSSAGMVVASMLFACTMTNYRKIAGIQGRYFLPLVALIPLISKKEFLQVQTKEYGQYQFAMQCVNIAYAWSVLHFWILNYYLV